MNNILGIVGEYNPFHNGHLYHLKKSKELTNSDYSIAIISGNFTQRGATSIIDKWKKAELVLENGFDLVIELPLLYSISSAENFAYGAINILNSLKIVDYVSFGAESKKLDNLNLLANFFNNEPTKYKNILHEELKKGLSFPKARENALNSYFGNSDFSTIISCPNNILGIEYLKALNTLNSDITPFLINRINAKHNDLQIYNNYASSSTIRTLLKNNDFEAIKNIIPENTFNTLIKYSKDDLIAYDLCSLEKEILYAFRKYSLDEISELPDVSEGLEFIIKKASNSCSNINDFINSIKSKRYPEARIRRILIYGLLGITKKDMLLCKNVIPYIRVLGFNKNGKSLISQITKKNPNLKIITSVRKFIDSLNIENSNDADLKRLLDFDILATNIYSLATKNNYCANKDFTTTIIEKNI